MKKRFKRIYIEITNVCNRNCSFCSPTLRTKKQMSVSQFEHILQEITPFTDYIYLHVKGEPLLHSHFSEILDLCDKYAIKVNITTNGTLLEQQSSILINHPSVRQINVSLHNFNKSEEKIYLSQILRATKQILEQSPIYVNYRFWTLENNQLTPSMERMLSYIIQWFHLDPRILENISVCNTQKLKENLFLSKGDLFEWPSLTNKHVSNVGTCHGLRDHIGILCDGNVVPCCLDGNGDINLGNIFEMPFIEIINSSLAVTIKQGFQNNQVINSLCQKCSYRTRFDK